MLKMTLAVAIATSLLGFSFNALAAESQPSTQVRKSASPKAKKPVKPVAKPKTAQGKKKEIPRVEEAPDFRA